MPVDAPPAPPSSGSATVQEVNIVDSPPPAPPPAPKTELHVTPATVESGPQEKVKKGSAMERMQQELRKKAKPQFFEEAPAPTPTEQPQSPPAEEPTSAPQPEAGQQPTEGKPSTAEPASKGKEEKGEKNPWKLMEGYKSEAAKYKQRIAELEKQMPELTKLEALQKSIAETNTRNEELEKEIRYHNYAKSKEFQDKYEKPYNAVWARVAKEVEQIAVTDRDGNQRAGNVQDIVEVANLPLGEAQKLAEERFGSLAPYVMNYRAKILEMNEDRQNALQQAKDDAIARDKQYYENQNKTNGELASHIKQTWSKANEELLNDKTHGHLFQQVDGDEDGNARLAKGFELVDRAFSSNPNDPRLTPEQRDIVVKQHAAVRLRAAAFGRLNAKYLKLQSQFNSLQKEMDAIKSSTPGTGSANGAPTPAGEQKGWDRIRAGLQKIAK